MFSHTTQDGIHSVVALTPDNTVRAAIKGDPQVAHYDRCYQHSTGMNFTGLLILSSAKNRSACPGTFSKILAANAAGLRSLAGCIA